MGGVQKAVGFQPNEDKNNINEAVLETDYYTVFRSRGIPTDLLDGKAGVNCASDKCVAGTWR